MATDAGLVKMMLWAIVAACVLGLLAMALGGRGRKRTDRR